MKGTLKNKGFTLVELLAVIVVLAIVMVVVADRVGDAMKKARGNSLAVQVKNVEREIRKTCALNSGTISSDEINAIVTDLGFTPKKDNTNKYYLYAHDGSKFANVIATNDAKNLEARLITDPSPSSWTSTNVSTIDFGTVSDENLAKWEKNPIVYIQTECD